LFFGSKIAIDHFVGDNEEPSVRTISDSLDWHR